MQSAAQLIVMRHSAEIEAKVRAKGRAEGRAEGRTEGRTEGRAEGRTEGRARVLIILLRQKFKSVPQGVAQRVAQASPEELDRWAPAHAGCRVARSGGGIGAG